VSAEEALVEAARLQGCLSHCIERKSAYNHKTRTENLFIDNFARNPSRILLYFRTIKEGGIREGQNPLKFCQYDLFGTVALQDGL
jgi:hypothetical protein